MWKYTEKGKAKRQTGWSAKDISQWNHKDIFFLDWSVYLDEYIVNYVYIM